MHSHARVHCGMLRLVARPLPVRDCHFHRIPLPQIFICGGRLRLAGRPLDSLNGLHTPPRPYLREYRARCLAASDKLTSCSTGWEAVHRPMQGIAVCSAKLGDGEVVNFVTLSNSCSSHLDGPGEPSGATWRPRGRPWRPPECPDVHGRASDNISRRGKRVKSPNF